MLDILKEQLQSLANQYKEIMASMSKPTVVAAPVANITGSVGNKGTNNPADVKLVQQLLNKKYKAGLAEDGSCGKLTITAIAKYQQVVLGYSKPDGRIDVGGKTWQALSGNTTAPVNNGGNNNGNNNGNTTPVVVVPTGKEIANPETPAPNAKLPQATEIVKEGAWSKRKEASIITATPEQVQEVIKKANSAGSPCFLESRPLTKVANSAEIPAGVDAFVKGKSQVPRPKQELDLGGSLDKTYGYIDRSKIGNREKKIPADKQAAAEFESKYITYISTPLFKNKIGVHKKVAASLKMALDEIFNFYGGAEGCKAFGLTSGYGWNFRNISKGIKPSPHAWGIAIDICAVLNQLDDLGKDPLFAQAPYQPFVDILEKYGWFSLGRWSRNTGFDSMHFQATTL